MIQTNEKKKTRRNSGNFICFSVVLAENTILQAYFFYITVCVFNLLEVVNAKTKRHTCEKETSLPVR